MLFAPAACKLVVSATKALSSVFYGSSPFCLVCFVVGGRLWHFSL